MAKDYWFECIAASLDEHGVTVTEEQLQAIAGDIEGAHDNYAMAHYSPRGPSPVVKELDEARKLLRIEKEKVTCKECGGRGRIYSYGPSHGSDSQCGKCRGDGRHSP